MRVKLQKILDRGVPNKERLWLKVLQDTDMRYYIVFDTRYISQKSISTFPAHTYWFGPKIVSSGDNVVLGTYKGTYNSKQNTDGTTTHYYYWGNENTIWNNEGDCAVLFEISSWETSPYE
jgi:hypothetical protein